jgi:hypothetical protein
MLCFAGYEFDPQRAELRGPDGEAIRLRPKAFDMLQLFAANPGRVLSKHDLIEAIWPNVHVSDDSLFQCVREIHAALGDDQRQLIQLVSCPGRLLPLPRGDQPFRREPCGLRQNIDLRSIRGTESLSSTWASLRSNWDASTMRWPLSSKPTDSMRRRCLAGPGCSEPGGPTCSWAAATKHCPGCRDRLPSRRERGAPISFWRRPIGNWVGLTRPRWLSQRPWN